MNTPQRRGLLVIISSPSGAGKTTLARRLLREFGNTEFSVSYTTRRPRIGEVEGQDYHFVDEARFEQMVAAGEFAEHAFVHGNRYGTSKRAVERALVDGRDVVFDVDWQGGCALSRQWPDDALMIFILPPDLATLEQRLRRRATDTEEVIQRRLQKAIDEIAYHDRYQFCIVNEELELAYGLLRAIYLQRCQRAGAPPAEVGAEELARAEALLVGHPVSCGEHARRLLRAGGVASDR